ncbi:carotenoid 1,2-hydratase [Aquincola sp. MAHUQ-54]|uniref:Carotenoid 1,2-hydratase n=1 Tax=Aquincola agrisoli TaxID=3119538 RepID=A0AAW9PYR9_9BURK
MPAWPADAAAAGTGIGPRPLVFPRDFGAHPETRTEWWYATGSLQAAPGDAPFGFQLTFFRSRTDLATRHPSRFAARQLLFAHAAVTDLAQRQLRHAERIARWNGEADAGLAAAAVADTDVGLAGWRFVREGPPGASVYRARLSDRPAGFGFDLALRSTQPVLLQGEAGWSRKGPEAAQASHYYSQPQLAVSGTLVRDARRLPVTGTAWLDHEWSETLMHPEAVGWDWIGMNLDDGGALTAFQLRKADGSAIWAGGSYRARGGEVRAFGPGEVAFVPGRTWTSPATRSRYPVQWTVATPAGRFEVRALLDAQELDSRASTGAIYWEGLSDLHEAGSGRRVGRGYLEMTGRASPLRLG